MVPISTSSAAIERMPRSRIAANSMPPSVTVSVPIRRAGGRPSSVAYSLYDDRVTVRITDIYGSAEAVRRFDRSTCRDYEMIDFR